MAEQLPQTNHSSITESISKKYFTRIFRGFRLAIHPSKLLLALAGVIVIYLAGSILDGLTPQHLSVVTSPDAVNSNQPANHLEAYVQSGHDEAQMYNQQIIKAIDLKRDALLATTTEIADNDASASQIQSVYDKHFDNAVDILEERYELREDYIIERYKTNLDEIGIREEAVGRLIKQKDEDLELLNIAYRSLFNAVVNGYEDPAKTENWILQMIVVDDRKILEDERDRVDNYREAIRETILLAQIWQLTQAREGDGVFATLNSFYGQRLMSLVSSLVLEWNLTGARQAVLDSLMGLCWLSRYHCIYGFFFLMIWLAVWALFGGAICRIAALQLARDERIGPVHALKFSTAKLFSFFTAPLMPLLIIILIAVAMYLISLIGALPGLGELLAGLLLGLALAGGFIIALVSVGLVGGINLMYPAIAVEGSDNFDAISRSFSYVFGRPWHMAFYSLVALVYGAICFLFVRLFVFILLLSVRIPMQAAMNIDGSSNLAIRGKLDAIWPAPTFMDLHPTINFSTLGYAESFSAFLIWFWVSIVIGLSVAFVISFYFSVNTTIYYLLRKHVDATNFDDVHVDEPEEPLFDQPESQDGTIPSVEVAPEPQQTPSKTPTDSEPTTTEDDSPKFDPQQ